MKKEREKAPRTPATEPRKGRRQPAKAPAAAGGCAQETNPVGRPPWIPGEDDIVKAYELAHDGLYEYQIAEALGISVTTLIEKRKEYPEFSTALIKGRADGIAEAARILRGRFKTDQSPSAVQFFLERRGGWIKREEISGPDGGPIQVNAATPDPSSAGDVARLLACLDMDALCEALASLPGDAQRSIVARLTVGQQPGATTAAIEG